MSEPSYHRKLMREVVTPCVTRPLLDRPIAGLALLLIVLAVIGVLHVFAAFALP